MAEMAVADEADVGYGPGAMLAVLTGIVGPAGGAVGVDRDPQAVEYANRAVADHPHASAHTGDAHLTGLPVNTFDVAMCRHVLARNGGRELAIVSHLATLVRPGGAVFLVEVDLAGSGLFPAPPGRGPSSPCSWPPAGGHLSDRPSIGGRGLPTGR